MMEENTTHSSKLASCVVEVEEREGDDTINIHERRIFFCEDIYAMLN
jgi:hypothetical protein